MTWKPMTETDQIEALTQVGYTELEARFLLKVALHSGYFLRRQATPFFSGNACASVGAFIEKLFENGHVTAIAFDPDTHLYHLANRTFYALIGEEDNRNRRMKEASTIKTRLMQLDFVLGQSQMQFLATEPVKRHYFTAARSIEETLLPYRVYNGRHTYPARRFFIEKYPIFVTEGANSEAIVSFCFVDEGFTTMSHFELFLSRYSRLLTALGNFQIVYVAARKKPFGQAGAVFEKYLNKWQAGMNATDSLLQRLRSYFSVRLQYDNKEFAALDRVTLTELRAARNEFSGPENERLFDAWKTGGDTALRQLFAPESVSRQALQGSFSTHYLEHNYDFLGTITSL